MSHMYAPMGENTALNKKTEEILKDSKLGSFESKREDDDVKYQVFSEISCLSHAACEMYVSGELSFDEAVSELSQAVLKFKGKEKELLKLAEKPENDKDDEE